MNMTLLISTFRKYEINRKSVRYCWNGSSHLICCKSLGYWPTLAVWPHMTSGLQRSSKGFSLILCLFSKGLERKVQRSGQEVATVAVGLNSCVVWWHGHGQSCWLNPSANICQSSSVRGYFPTTLLLTGNKSTQEIAQLKTRAGWGFLAVWFSAKVAPGKQVMTAHNLQGITYHYNTHSQGKP